MLRYFRLFAGFGLVTCSAVGCLSLAVERCPDSAAVEAARALPQCCKSGVRVYLVNTADPLDTADLSGVQQHLFSLGYTQVTLGQVWHAGIFRNEILARRAANPDEQIVLIGYGQGARTAANLADELAAASVPVYGVISLDGPAQAAPKTAVVRFHRVRSKADDGSGHDTIVIPDAISLRLPTHPATLGLISETVAEAAQLVPVCEYQPLTASPSAEAPTPRPVMARQPSESNFLRPLARLPKPDETLPETLRSTSMKPKE